MAPTAATIDALRSVPFLDAVDRSSLASLASRLVEARFAPGDVVMRRGDRAVDFALLVGGQVEIRGGHGEVVAALGPGSLVGELGLITERPRLADVVARLPTWMLLGDMDAFDQLLRLPGVRARIAEVVARRLAEGRAAVRLIRDRKPLALRSLLPSDRAAFIDALHRLSGESLRRRFFSGGAPPEHVIEYLLSTNHIDHFAWVALDPQRDEGLGVARFIRHRAVPECAEVSFAVADHHQGRGIATVLLGAIGVSAELAGITTLDAHVLDDNVPMRAVFAKVYASTQTVEPGVVGVEVPVSAASTLLEPREAQAVRDYAADIVTAGGLTLANPLHTGG